jgi:pilus assembly protein CpaF
LSANRFEAISVPDITTGLVNEIRQAVSQEMDLGKDINDEEIQELITSSIFKASQKSYLNLEQKHALADVVFNSMRRLGILQPLLEDSAITEIMVNGPGNIFTEKNGRLYRTNLKFESSEQLGDIIQSIVSASNRSVNEANPIVDVSLKDGSRVNVVLKPVAINGPVMTIRKFPKDNLSMNQLINMGTVTKEAAVFLELLVRAKYNIFICGGTGSGKTTLLNALSDFIPKDERIITIEDTAELKIHRIDNLVSLETRNANTEGRGKITVSDLIRTSLRMRPERIIVGEVRGPEALDMLQAMNTGHDGSISTGHANSCRDMIMRLETMVLEASAIPLQAIRRHIASAIDIMIHIGRLRDRTRKVLEIVEIENLKDGDVVLNPLFVFEEELKQVSEQDNGCVKGSLKKTSNDLFNVNKFEMAGIKYEWKYE